MNLNCNGCAFNKVKEMTDVRDETLEIHGQYAVPQPIKILFIAESPPFGFSKNKEQYFYACGKINTKGLFYHMMSAIFDEFSTRADGSLKEDFLKKFEEKGYYLIDMVKCPINHFKKEKKKDRKSAINFCAKNLKEEISSLKPEKIVFIGETSFKILAKNPQFKIVEKQLGLQSKPEVLYFPSRSQKNKDKFKTGLKNILATAK